MAEIVYISIGNSDDKLTQARWSEFVGDVARSVHHHSGGVVHGEWRSLPDAQWQNACWCLQFPDDPQLAAGLKTYLAYLAGKYDQDSIAWAVVAGTEFIRG